MTLTVTLDGRDIEGTSHVARGTMAFDSSYPTGGEAYTSHAQFGFQKIAELEITPYNGYTFQWDETNKKILAYDGATQVANTTDLSALSAVKWKSRSG